MMTSTEKWMAVDGFPYEVSSHGRVRRTKAIGCTWVGRVRKLCQNKWGYLITRLLDGPKHRTVTVHILVASAFLGPRPEGKEVNHKDGVKHNNHASNLEYVTRSENNSHAFSLGLKCVDGERNPQAKITEGDVREIRKLRAGGMKNVDIAKSYPIGATMVSQICVGRAWSHVR